MTLIKGGSQAGVGVVAGSMSRTGAGHAIFRARPGAGIPTIFRPGIPAPSVPARPHGKERDKLTDYAPLDQLDRPSYPAAEAGRLVGLTAPRVRRWLKGYEYSYRDTLRHQPPVLGRVSTTAGTTYASFLDLVDLLFARAFLNHGFSLQKVRRALDEARQLLGTSHFARETFFTDGGSIYLQLRDRGEAILELLSGGQWVIAPVIRQLARQIDFGSPEGLARRWYPLGRRRPVILDPLVSFGAPSIVGRGVKTANVHDLFVAEQGSVAAVRSWWNLTDAEVKAAVEFERSLAA